MDANEPSENGNGSAETLAKVGALAGDEVQEKLARQYGLEIFETLEDVPYLIDQAVRVPYAFVKAPFSTTYSGE